MSIAYLAITFRLENILKELPRRRRILVDPGTPLYPVFRLERNPRGLPLRGETSRKIRTRILEIATRYRSPLVQIDYDARSSERADYLMFLRTLRDSLPPGTRVSMTALASWCLFDRWLADAPVDEIVPMAFRMGADGPRVRQRLNGGGDFLNHCRGAMGIITDEAIRVPPGRRVYIFSARRWNDARIKKAQQILRTRRRKDYRP